MNKKVNVITILILSILLILFLIIRTTYSLIIEVIDNGGKSEILNNIDIRDLVTDQDGIYNSYYYDAIGELNINNEEADIIMNSQELNKVLDNVISSVVEYRLHGRNRLSDNQIYNLIESAVNNDNNINNELKDKILKTTQKYLSDITDYLYDIKTSLEAYDV